MADTCTGEKVLGTTEDFSFIFDMQKQKLVSWMAILPTKCHLDL